MTGRIVCLDYGEKRVGLAVSDPLLMTAQPRPFIPNNRQLLSAIASLCTELEVRTIIVGLPLKPDGSDSAKTLEVREFAQKVGEHTQLPVLFRDERFSTVAVTRNLIDADVSRAKRKTVVDSQAAAFVLQGYLDALRIQRERNEAVTN
ncbi:Holliday junction resolvase RuvX [bacterium]|nr:Holliday junction resolvase RuvX [bacterium]